MNPIANTWVVYEKLVFRQTTGLNAICKQAEWEAMEVDSPGRHTLIKAHIATEQQAERYARSGSGRGITSVESQAKKLALHND